MPWPVSNHHVRTVSADAITDLLTVQSAMACRGPMLCRYARLSGVIIEHGQVGSAFMPATPTPTPLRGVPSLRHDADRRAPFLEQTFMISSEIASGHPFSTNGNGWAIDGCTWAAASCTRAHCSRTSSLVFVAGSREHRQPGPPPVTYYGLRVLCCVATYLGEQRHLYDVRWMDTARAIARAAHWAPAARRDVRRRSRRARRIDYRCPGRAGAQAIRRRARCGMVWCMRPRSFTVCTWCAAWTTRASIGSTPMSGCRTCD